MTVEADCDNILETLLDPHPEFASLIKDVIPDVTPENITAVFRDPTAEVTMFVPPREHAAGLQNAYNVGDLTAEQVRHLLF